MYKKILLSLFFIFFVGIFYGQEISTSVYHHYKGTISDKYPITMDVIIHGNEIKGTYYYNNVGELISLNGTIDEHNNVKMKEYLTNESSSGSFDGKILSDSFNGVWRKKNSSKKLKFKLKEDYNHSAQLNFYHFNDKINLFDNNDSINFILKGTFFFPVSCSIRAAQAFVYDDLQKYYFIEPCESIEKCINKFVEQSDDEYLSIKNDYSEESILDMYYSFCWDSEDTISILYNDDDILSFEVSGYSYTGGAHGNAYADLRNYDIHYGKVIQLSDLFIDNYEMKLLSLIKQKIIEQKKEEEIFSLDEVEITENFAMLKKGIVFIYNEYEIGPYSSGQFEFYFPYDVILDLLRPEIKQRLEL